MDLDQQTELWIKRALGEVERDFSLPNNSLVDETPLPKIREGVRLKTMEVQLDQNFMARAPDNLIKHSREPKLRKRVAEQEETISLLMNGIDLLLEKYVNVKSKTAPLGATKYHESNDQRVLYTLYEPGNALYKNAPI